MKKSLIALAALAAVSAVSAQSTVSVYGRLDLGYAAAKQTTPWGLSVAGSTAFETQETKASSFGNHNARTTSRLGFNGTEDLGGGLKAMFNYEVALAPDNIGTKTGTGDTALGEQDGARIGFGITRLANLGVSGGFGTVVMGTFLNAHDALRGFSVHTNGMAGGDFMARHNAQITDAGTASATFVNTATSSIGNEMLFDLTLSANSTATAGYTAQALKAVNGIGINGRSHNAIAYSSPVMSGFSVGLGVQADKTNRTGSQAANARSISGQTIALNYAQGPLKATYVHGTGKNTDKDGLVLAGAAYGSSKATDSGFGASYDLGVAQVFLVSEGVKANIYGGLLDGYSAKTNATEVGVKFPMGAFTPYALMGSGKITVNDGTDSTEFKTKATQVGTTYDLSKRSSLYLSIGRDEVLSGGVGLKRSGTTAGLIHTF